MIKKLRNFLEEHKSERVEIVEDVTVIPNFHNKYDLTFSIRNKEMIENRIKWCLFTIPNCDIHELVYKDDNKYHGYSLIEDFRCIRVFNDLIKWFDRNNINIDNVKCQYEIE